MLCVAGVTQALPYIEAVMMPNATCWLLLPPNESTVLPSLLTDAAGPFNTCCWPVQHLLLDHRLLRSPSAALPHAGAGRCPGLLGGALNQAVAAFDRPRHAINVWWQARAVRNALALDWQGPVSPASRIRMAVNAGGEGPVRVPVE
jgi:hypothetical protein